MYRPGPGKGSNPSSRRGSGKLDNISNAGMTGASPTIMSLLESILSDEA
jgi:hypothetical protein